MCSIILSTECRDDDVAVIVLAATTTMDTTTPARPTSKLNPQHILLVMAVIIVQDGAK